MAEAESLGVAASAVDVDVVTFERCISEGTPQALIEAARLYRGDVVGEMALLTGEPRSASAVAAVPTEALELGRDGIARIIARHPAVLANLSRILSRRLARANSTTASGMVTRKVAPPFSWDELEISAAQIAYKITNKTTPCAFLCF